MRVLPSSSLGKQSQLLLQPTEVELGLQVEWRLTTTSFNGVSRSFQGYFKIFSRVFQGILMGVVREHLGCFIGVSRVRSMGVKRKLWGRF